MVIKRLDKFSEPALGVEDTLTGKKLEDRVYYVNDPITILKPDQRSLGDEDKNSDSRYDFIQWLAATPMKNVTINPTTLTGDLSFNNINVTPTFFGTDKDGNQVQKLEFISQYNRYYKYYLTFYNSNGAIIKEGDTTFDSIKYYINAETFKVPKAEINTNKIFNFNDTTQYDDHMTYNYEFLGWTSYGSNETTGQIVLNKNNYNITIKDLFKDNNTSSKTLQLIPRYQKSKKTYELKFETIPGGLPGGLTGTSVAYKPITETIKVGWKEPITPPTVTATGYTFNGWSLSKTTNINLNPETYTFGILNDENIAKQTYYAKWKINEYQVEYKYIPYSADDDTKLWYTVQNQWKTTTPQTVTYGGTPTQPGTEYQTNPISVNIDVKFTGWETLEWKNVNNTTKTIILNAIYDTSNARTYTITFKDWNGNVLPSSNPWSYGSTPSIANPSREGHTFAGWSPSIKTVTGTQTYTATYTVNSYTLTYSGYSDFNGKKVVTEPKTVEYGASLSLYPPTASKFVRTGYDRTGWTSIPATMPASDLTINAVYSIKTFTVTWKTHQQDTIKVTDVPYNTYLQYTKPFKYGFGSKIGNTDLVYIDYDKSATLKITSDTEVIVKVKKCVPYNLPINWGTSGTFSENQGTITYNDDTKNHSFSCSTEGVLGSSRKLGIRTKDIFGKATTIQSITVTYDCTRTTSKYGTSEIFFSIQDTFAINPDNFGNAETGSAGTGKTMTLELDSDTKNISNSGETTGDSGLYNSNGVQGVWLGVWHSVTGDTEATFSNVSFSVVYHENIENYVFGNTIKTISYNDL